MDSPAEFLLKNSFWIFFHSQDSHGEVRKSWDHWVFCLNYTFCKIAKGRCTAASDPNSVGNSTWEVVAMPGCPPGTPCLVEELLRVWCFPEWSPKGFIDPTLLQCYKLKAGSRGTDNCCPRYLWNISLGSCDKLKKWSDWYTATSSSQHFCCCGRKAWPDQTSAWPIQGCILPWEASSSGAATLR